MKTITAQNHGHQVTPAGLIRTAWILAAGATVLGQVALAEEPGGKKIFRAGAATSNITPWLGEKIVGGWSPFPATHIHDELHARCLVLDDGATRIALVVIDKLSISREDCDEAKRMIREVAGLPEDRVLIAATHTHSAASVFPSKEFLPRRIAEGVQRAMNNLEPARIGWGVTVAEEHVNNRRWFLKPDVKLVNPWGGEDKVKMNPGAGRPELLKPAGPVDPQICFLSVQSAEGRPIALLANYSLHYVGGVGQGHISADYFAMFADRLQQLIGADRLEPPFVGIMSNGTSGDVNNINFREGRPRKQPYEQMRLVAHDVAQKVFEAYRDVKYHDHVSLRMAQRELTLATRKPTPEQLARAREIEAGAKPIPDRPHEDVYAKRILGLEKAPPTVSAVLQAVRVGEVGIASIPFEVFAEIGLEIKAKSPFKPTFTIEQANGGYGYLPTPEQHALGGYETWLGTCRVETEASTKIVKNLLEMFNELK
ncbi:MAG: hypothetical protein AB1696_01490 [Planctomycetota bacterium]